MAREYFGSDGGAINETGSRQFFGSDGGAVNETSSTAVTISGIVGNAVAAGAVASILAAVTVSGITGNAVAAGSTATITNSGTATTINATVGNTAAAGATATITNLIKTSAMINNTETGPLASVPVSWTWWPAGRPGSMTGVTPTDGTGTTDAGGKLTPGITAAPGVLMVAALGVDRTADQVFYQAYK